MIPKRLKAAAAALDEGTAEPKALSALIAEAHTAGPQASPKVLAEIAQALTNLESAVDRQLQRIKAQLTAAGANRTAVGAYGVLRSDHTGQHLRRRV